MNKENIKDWNALSESYLPTRIEYLREFEKCWNWENIVQHRDISWNNAIFTEFEHLLLPVLATSVFENLVDEVTRPDDYSHPNPRRRRRHYHGCVYYGLLDQLIESDANKLKIKILSQFIEEENHTEKQTKWSTQVQELIDNGVL
jgi:hypothetical protein